MHESGLVRSLLREVEKVAGQYAEPRVLVVRLSMGALCPFSEAHLREHFTYEAKGTLAEQADLVIDHGTDPTDPTAQDLLLLSLEIEDISALAPSPAEPVLDAAKR
jgi:hydrogenase nickel incorporation protein HypA/HybF